MTDKELLELAAAKAVIENIVTSEVEPLKALLRLAVKLQMTIEIYSCGCIAIAAYNTIRCEDFDEEDPLAATCRAITRAAAEIGRAKT